MYHLRTGKISRLSEQPLTGLLGRQPPPVKNRQSWIAGRVLLSQMNFPQELPEIIDRSNGKPGFYDNAPLWFSISHSGDDIAVLTGDDGEVGCDIEVIRPRNNWRRVAGAVFSTGELKELMSAPEADQLATFWRIWTCKEALVKQQGGSVCQIARADSTRPDGVFLSHYQSGKLCLATCTRKPFVLTSVI